MKMRLLINTGLWAGAALIVSILNAVAAEFPHPEVEYSADMVMEIGMAGTGQVHQIKGRVYAARGKERREITQFGRTTAIIKDRDKQASVTLMPHQKMYMENKDAKAGKDPEARIRGGELKLTPQGAFNLNGQQTRKYKIESAQKGEASFTGYVWFSKENIPVRFKGTARGDGMQQDVEINYTNIVIAKQAPGLFKIPGDYRPIPGGFGGMGGGASGMTPEQLEALKQMMKKQGKQ